MLSRPEQAAMNLDQARHLRSTGLSYAQIRQSLDLTVSQIALIRRTLKRTKAAETRLHRKETGATVRDLPIGQCTLPPDLRKRLTAAGFRTLGDLELQLADPTLAGLETLPAIGPYRMRLIKRMLEHYDLLPGRNDLKAAIEELFPDLRDDAPTSLISAP